MAETIPGGYYLGTDGEPHDANGRPVKKLSDRALKTARGKAEELSDAQREALAAQRAAEQRAMEAEEAAEKAGTAVDSAEAAVKAADKQAKQAGKR
ncbi:MAG: hypothetical protein H0V63_05555 [Burkholderiaceae bacterium]|nr:hypothetical protein [Burkholderiaceae bacterium]